MTTPTITLYPDTMPAKEQANAAFDTNVDNFMDWLTLTNGPELQTMITYTQDVADNVLATALAGDLPPLTGKAGDYIRANAAENGGEFRTVAQVLADISAAPLASPALTGAPTAPTPTIGTNTTQIATAAMVQAALGSYATPANTTSGTAFDFTGIPAAVNLVEMYLNEVSLDGADFLTVQLGTSGGVVSSGYIASSGRIADDSSNNVVNRTSAFPLEISNSSLKFSGIISIRRLNSGSNTWVSSHAGRISDVQTVSGGGRVALSGELTQLRLGISGGGNLFDGGQVNIRWSY